MKQGGIHIVILFFFFNDTATTEIYTLSLHDALPIWGKVRQIGTPQEVYEEPVDTFVATFVGQPPRSEEHTSELQSQSNLVCRLLLEKKKKYARRRDSCILRERRSRLIRAP